MVDVDEWPEVSCLSNSGGMVWDIDVYKKYFHVKDSNILTWSNDTEWYLKVTKLFEAGDFNQ